MVPAHLLIPSYCLSCSNSGRLTAPRSAAASPATAAAGSAQHRAALSRCPCQGHSSSSKRRRLAHSSKSSSRASAREQHGRLPSRQS